MKTSEKQWLFTKAVAMLIFKADELGIALSFGDAFRDDRCPYGHPQSTHRHRLAVDLIARVDGVYSKGVSKEAHNLLHDYWDTLGGSRRIAKDLNHYSFEHNGVI